ncbi:hypothetical protein [Streptomyces melanogenes]|nr:hypothetical protein GCM10010278_80140 [Streptomyces melanogenes]
MLPYSYSLLNQVECGARPATADFTAVMECTTCLNTSPDSDTKDGPQE